MRTTLTLDPDVAEKLKDEARRSGASFKEIVNHFLRMGLKVPRKGKPARRFRVRARAMGIRAGLDYDSIPDLLESLEGPDSR